MSVESDTADTQCKVNKINTCIEMDALKKKKKGQPHFIMMSHLQPFVEHNLPGGRRPYY